MKSLGLAILLPLLLLSFLAAIPPVTANHGSIGENIALGFSPSEIEVGQRTYLLISVSAPKSTTLYVYFYVDLPDWLDYDVSEIVLGDFVRGGVVVSCYYRAFCGGLQIAVVVPAGNNEVFQIPIYASQVGLFTLHKVFIFEGGVADGYINSYLHTGFLDPNSPVKVYDPEVVSLKQSVLDVKLRLANLEAQLANYDDKFGVLGSKISTLNTSMSQFREETLQLFRITYAWISVVLGLVLACLLYQVFRRR